MVKNKRNPYSEFINSRRPTLEAKLGRKLSFDEVSQMVAKEWTSMGPEEKKKYKVNDRNTCPMDSYGVPLAHHEARQREEKAVIDEMDDGINDFVRAHDSPKSVRLLSFTTVCVSEYLVKEEGGYKVFPAEISLVNTSLGQGVDPDHYHSIVLPEKWPQGFYADVRKTSQDIHYIPLTERDHDETDTKAKYCEPHSEPQHDATCRNRITVKDEVNDFLQKVTPSPYDPNTKYQVIYTLNDDLKKTRSLFYDRFDKSPATLKIWSLERLLKFMNDIYGVRDRFTLQNATTNIKDPKECLDFNLSIVCKWHQVNAGDQINHCSLSKAKRYSHHLLMCLNLTNTFKIQVIEGRHWPRNNNMSQFQNMYRQAEPVDRPAAAQPVIREPTVMIGARPKSRVSALRASLGVQTLENVRKNASVDRGNASVDRKNAPVDGGNTLVEGGNASVDRANAPVAEKWRPIARDNPSPFDASQFPSLPSVSNLLSENKIKSIMKNAQLFSSLVNKGKGAKDPKN